MNKIGIIGYGFVGKGIHRLIGEEVVSVYDPFISEQEKKDAAKKSSSKTIFNKKESFNNLDMVIISVSTKESKNGQADTSIVKKSLKWVSKETNFKGIFLIKSTVPPGEMVKLSRKYKKFVFSPEYIGESKYFTPPWKYPDPVDIKSHTWQIFGGEKTETSRCVDIFKKKMGVDTVFIQVDLVTAVLTKYMDNSFGAMKVTFCNEWFEIAKTFGVDYNKLRECWLSDPRVNRNHTLVFPESRGYGGKCFPKDIRAIIYDSEKKGYNPQLMKAMDKTNKKFKKMNKN